MRPTVRLDDDLVDAREPLPFATVTLQFDPVRVDPEPATLAAHPYLLPAVALPPRTPDRTTTTGAAGLLETPAVPARVFATTKRYLVVS